MSRIRPSLHRLEKDERKAGDLYAAHHVAQELVLARLRDALDRIRVAASFSEFSGAVPAQLGHAVKFIRFGAQNEVERFGSPVVGEESAADIVRILSDLYHDALVDELLQRAYDRDGTVVVE